MSAGRVSSPLLEVEDLSVEIATASTTIRPTDHVTYSIFRGEVVALVGESGCGKTMTALATTQLLPPGGRIVGGTVRFDGLDLTRADEHELRAIRGDRVSYVGQDATASLNPVLKIRSQLCEGLETHLNLDRGEARRRAGELLHAVGIPAADERLDAYPHELSGGMRQRVAIAIALSCDPELLIADEPTTALDATVQAQIVDLLLEIASARDVAILLISHDLSLVAAIANRVMVMYAGRLIESGPATAVTEHPRHPYTEALLAATPRLHADEDATFDSVLPGHPPNLEDIPPGCRFSPRCPYVRDRCRCDDPIEAGSLQCWYPLATARPSVGGGVYG